MNNVLETYTKMLNERKPDYAALMGGAQKAEALVSFALNAISGNPALLDCTRESFFLACRNGALSGLDPNPALGHCYLVPRKGKVFLQIGYKGFLALAYETAGIICRAELVREGDRFEYELGTNRFIRHTPKIPNEGKFVAGYARATIVSNGHEELIVRDIADVNKVRDSYSEYKAGPWTKNYYEMACKTLLRWVLKTMPLSPILQQAVGIDELAEHELKQNTATNVKEALRGLKQAEGRVVEPEPEPKPEPKNEQASFLDDLSFTGKIPG